MSRADDLRAQADAIEAEERLAAEYEAAVEAYRADPTEAAKQAYKDAAQALRDARRTARSDRTGVGVGGDAFLSNGSGG